MLAAGWTALAALIVGPVWGLWGALGGVAVVASRRRRLPELTALACTAVIAVFVVGRERRVAPLPNGGWPSTFEAVHPLGMFAVVCVLVGALVARDAVVVSEADHDRPFTEPPRGSADETADDATSGG